MGNVDSRVGNEAESALPEEIEEDLRVRRWRARLQISQKELDQLYFNPYLLHMEDDRGIPREAISKWLKEPHTELIDAMIDFVEPSKFGYVSYGEILELICIFCRFSHRQLVMFIFTYLDERREHFLSLDVLRHYVTRSHGDGGSFQIQHAFKVLASQVKGNLVGLEELLAFDSQFPYMFFPSSKPLTALIKRSFGERYWDIKRELIVDENAIAALKQDPDEEDEEDQFGEAAVKRRMQHWYFITPWRREYFRMRLRRMAIIDAELDELVDKMWMVTRPDWVRHKMEDEDPFASEDERSIPLPPSDMVADQELPDSPQLPLPSIVDPGPGAMASGLVPGGTGAGEKANAIRIKVKNDTASAVSDDDDDDEAGMGMVEGGRRVVGPPGF